MTKKQVVWLSNQDRILPTVGLVCKNDVFLLEEDKVDDLLKKGLIKMFDKSEYKELLRDEAAKNKKKGVSK